MRSRAERELAFHRVPCGAASVAASSVCRTRLRDKFDQLLDRLTEEIHPEYRKEEMPKGYAKDESGKLVNLEEMEEKARAEREPKIISDAEIEARRKNKLLKGMVDVDVKKEIQKYEEMGNSKLLQDISGKINKR